MEDQHGQVKHEGLSKNMVLKNEMKWKATDRAKLSALMATVCILQRQYGKGPQDLEVMVEAFAWALGKYQICQVESALKEYILENSTIPTPAEIRHIIDPIKPHFAPDWAVYNRFKDMLKNEGKYALTDDEFSYMRRCEEYSLAR